jgi:hypothetical protein
MTALESVAADARYAAEEKRFSVCTLVTDWDQYRTMLEAFHAREARIKEIEYLDPYWAVLGNAGGSAPGRLFIRISDPHDGDTSRGPFPARVSGLDENFLVVRRAANLAVSYDIAGFHLYATDLCLVADVLGWSSYVIDFHLQHLSPGKADASFKLMRTKLVAKWRRALRARWAVSPSASLYVAACGLATRLMNSGLGRKLARLRD